MIWQRKKETSLELQRIMNTRNLPYKYRTVVSEVFCVKACTIKHDLKSILFPQFLWVTLYHNTPFGKYTFIQFFLNLTPPPIKKIEYLTQISFFDDELTLQKACSTCLLIWQPRNRRKIPHLEILKLFCVYSQDSVQLRLHKS